MQRLKRAWNKIAHIVSIVSEVSQNIAALLTILAVLGVVSVATGAFADVLFLVSVGVLIVILAVVLFIFLATYFEENEVEKHKIQESIEQLKEQLKLAVEEKEAFTTPDISSVVRLGHSLAEKFISRERFVRYEYLPDGKTMIYRTGRKLEVIQDGVTSATFWYAWSGAGDEEVRSLTPGFEIANQRADDTTPDRRMYDVIFPRPFNKGEIVEYVTQVEVFDREGTAKPFLSEYLVIPTDFSQLEVVLPPNLAPRRVFFFEFEGYLDDLPIAVEELAWNPVTNSIVRKIDKPQLHHKYLIRWYPPDTS